MQYEFFITWVIVSFQFGPNSLNCFLAGLTQNYRKIAASLLGIMVVSFCLSQIILLGKAIFFGYVETYIWLVQLAGAAWIFYLGVKKIIGNEVLSFSEATDIEKDVVVWREILAAISISITNPKVLVFYVAIYAQYISGETNFLQDQILPILLLIAILIAYGSYALLGYFAGHFLKRSDTSILIGLIGGVCYIGIALYFITIIQ